MAEYGTKFCPFSRSAIGVVSLLTADVMKDETTARLSNILYSICQLCANFDGVAQHLYNYGGREHFDQPLVPAAEP